MKNIPFVLLVAIVRYYDDALRWLLRELTDGKSPLVQVMIGGRRARQTLREQMLTQFYDFKNGLDYILLATCCSICEGLVMSENI